MLNLFSSAEEVPLTVQKQFVLAVLLLLSVSFPEAVKLNRADAAPLSC